MRSSTAAWQSIDHELRKLKTMAGAIDDPDVTRWLIQLEQLLARLRHVQQTVENLAHSDANRPAIQMLENQALPLAEDMNTALQSLIDFEEHAEVSAERRDLLVDMANAQSSLANVTGAIRSLLITGETRYKNRFLTHWAFNQEAVAAIQAQEALLDSKQGEALSRLLTAHNQFSGLPEKMFRLQKSSSWNQANSLLATTAAPVVADVTELLNNIILRQNERVERDERHLAARTTVLLTVVVVASVLVTVLGTLIAWYIVRSITTPVNRMVSFMSKVANGDLTQQYQHDSHDEFGQLGDALNLAVASSANALAEVKRASEREAQLQAQRTEEASQRQQENAERDRAQADEQRREAAGLQAKVDKMLRAMHLVADGDYSSRIEMPGDDAVSNLGQGLQRFFDDMHQAQQWERELAAKENQRIKDERQRSVDDEREAKLSRSKVQELRTIVVAAAGGDLTKHIDVRGDEPVDDLALGIQKMVSDLRHIIGNIAD